jgi:hypothetical protein
MNIRIPFESLGNICQVVWDGGRFPNALFDPGTYHFSVYLELSGVRREPWDKGLLLGVHTLVCAGFGVRIHVELRIKWECIVTGVRVLVTLYVTESRRALKSPKALGDFVSKVPVREKS